jgi:hypothetical protein
VSRGRLGTGRRRDLRRAVLRGARHPPATRCATLLRYICDGCHSWAALSTADEFVEHGKRDGLFPQLHRLPWCERSVTGRPNRSRTRRDRLGDGTSSGGRLGADGYPTRPVVSTSVRGYFEPLRPIVDV